MPRVQFARGKGGAYTGLVAVELQLGGVSREAYARAMEMLHSLPQVAMTTASGCQ